MLLAIALGVMSKKKKKKKKKKKTIFESDSFSYDDNRDAKKFIVLDT